MDRGLPKTYVLHYFHQSPTGNLVQVISSRPKGFHISTHYKDVFYTSACLSVFLLSALIAMSLKADMTGPLQFKISDNIIYINYFVSFMFNGYVFIMELGASEIY